VKMPMKRAMIGKLSIIVLVILALNSIGANIAFAAGSVETLSPNAEGDETSLPVGGTDPADTNWESVDDDPSDDDTTYVEGGAALYEPDLYNLADTSLTGTINSITVYINCKGTKAGEGAYHRIKTNGIVYEGSPITLTTAYALYNTAYNNNPQAGNPWSWEEVNALQAGVALKKPTGGAKARCTQVYVEVSYTPSPNWESYKEVGSETVWGTEANPCSVETDTTIVYMFGDNYESGQLYHVGFYDASDPPNMVAITDPTSDDGGDLNTQYLLTSDPCALAGLWHATVYKDPDTPPASYIADDPNAVADDDFEVMASAIASPLVFLIMGMAGLAIWRRTLPLYIIAGISVLFVGSLWFDVGWQFSISIMALSIFLLYRGALQAIRGDIQY